MRSWFAPLVFFFFEVKALSLNGPVFHKTDLESLINERQIRSIEELIPALPAHFSGSRLEIYSSRSLHCSSHRAPRIVMYSPDGKLVCSYNSGKKEDYSGDSSVTGFTCDDTLNSLECMQWNDSLRRDEVFEIQFGPVASRNGDAPSQKWEGPTWNDHNKINETRCAACHGVDTRRFMEPYFAWPGFFGSSDDSHVLSRATMDPRELFGYQLFKQSTNPRYTALPPLTNISEGPNRMATKLFYDLHLTRSVRRFEEKRLRPYRALVISALVCNFLSISEGSTSEPAYRYTVEPRLLSLLKKNSARTSSLKFDSEAIHRAYLDQINEFRRYYREILQQNEAALNNIYLSELRRGTKLTLGDETFIPDRLRLEFNQKLEIVSRVSFEKSDRSGEVTLLSSLPLHQPLRGPAQQTSAQSQFGLSPIKGERDLLSSLASLSHLRMVFSYLQEPLSDWTTSFDGFFVFHDGHSHSSFLRRLALSLLGSSDEGIDGDVSKEFINAFRLEDPMSDFYLLTPLNHPQRTQREAACAHLEDSRSSDSI